MNPLISAEFLDREREASPEMYGQEYEAEFTVGGGSFIDWALLTRATGDLEHEGAHVRTLALDPAFSQDSYGLAVACSPEGSEVAYLEHVSVLKHPGFEESLSHVAQLAEEWDPRRTVTDQMSSCATAEAVSIRLKERRTALRMAVGTGREPASRHRSRSSQFSMDRIMVSAVTVGCG